MKILLATPDFPLWDGGVAVWAEKLAEFFARAGHDVTVLTPRQLPGDDEFDAARKYRVLRTRNVKARRIKYAYAHWRTRLLLRVEKFDHAIALTWYPFANALAGQVPLTLFAHGNDFMETRWQQKKWRGKMERAFAAANRIVAVSSETERELRRVLPGFESKTKVLFPAVDPAEFPSAPAPVAAPVVLLTLGRVVERKGQDMVIRALPKILREFPRVQYWIAGRGAHLEKLRALAAELQIGEKIRFLGLVPAAERVQLYQRCSVYLMPSRTIGDKGDFEGFGITYLEANACGRPVIGGRSGGVADAVLDGVTGLLVDPHSPDDVAEKTLQLLRDGNFAAQLARAGRERVERELNWTATAEKLLNLLREDR
jgi:phosphatidylinositol alpha-1,6-mannosyltransferase